MSKLGTVFQVSTPFKLTVSLNQVEVVDNQSAAAAGN